MNKLKITNSDVANDYVRTRRLSFLFSSLRVRGLLARDELAAIASRGSHDFESLIALVRGGAAPDQSQPDQSIPDTTKTLRRGPLLDLAWIIGNQSIHEHDIQDANAIYEFVLATWGPRSLTHQSRVDFALLKARLGEQTASREILRRIPTIYRALSWVFPTQLPSIKVQSINEGFNFFVLARKDYTLSTKFLKIDVTNPFRGLSASDALEAIKSPSTLKWLEGFNEMLFGNNLSPVAFVENPAYNPLESLTALVPAGKSEAVKTGPKVTIVISAFQPDKHVFTSVRSAMAQTYTNLEILVVDDASGSDYSPVLEQIAKLDPRIRVLTQAVNGGTYRIRNRAMDEASGELITFQDSDDWMHPQRIEVQVKQLLKNPKAIGNTTMSTRLTDRLEGTESNRRLRIGVCEPSLMFWREKVRERIGYFDGVRKGGDTEFRKRMDRAFGVDSSMVLPWHILTIQRADNGGLTQGELGFRWIAEFRLNYRDFYLKWHRQAQAEGSLYIARDDLLTDEEKAGPLGGRKFYAPRLSRMVAKQAREPRSFDLVLIANLKDSVCAEAALEKVEAALASGKTVGLCQINSFYPRHLSRSIGEPVLRALNAGKAELVYDRDQLKIDHVELLAPSAWLTQFSGQKFAWAFKSFGQVEMESAPESWRAEGETVKEMVSVSLASAFAESGQGAQ